jgi:hypothetical protein
MRRLAAVALAAGLGIGSIVALAIPRSHVVTRAPGPPSVAPERPRERDVPGLTAVPRTVHVELERRDPRGGPNWILRSFAARYVNPRGLPGHPEPSRNPNGQEWCVELLRRYHGRLGWIDGDNVFRPARPGNDQAPLACGDRLAPFRGEPFEGVVTLLTELSRPSARPLVTVAFGAGGTPARGAVLRLGGRTRKLKLTARGAFLEFVPSGADPGIVTFSYPRRTQTAPRIDAFSVFNSRQPLLPRRRSRPLAVQALAPDPNGGPPWAIAALRTRGRAAALLPSSRPATRPSSLHRRQRPAAPDRAASGWCLSWPERLVAGRLGTIDFPLGTFGSQDEHVYECQRPDDLWLRRHVVVAYYQPGSGGDPALATTSSRGPTERRTSPGTTLGWGVARSDVREITVTTPRDVRTIVPSGPAHAWLVVYDGGFPTGEITLTAHFADGSSRVVDRFDMGGV